MASFSSTFHLFLVLTTSTFLFSILSATLIEDLNTLHPPPDFNSTLFNNCAHNPSHKYCNSSPMDLTEIFKSTIVASYLCNESKNPNCIESFPKIDLRNRPKSVPLYLSFSFFWKYCPISIVSIDLANNSLKGNFPKEVLLCNQIQALDLSFNQLSGDFPVEIFTSLINLTFLNLSYNHFSETKVSDMEFLNRFNSSSFVHSGLLPKHRNYTIKAVILLVGFPVFVILMIVSMGWLCFVRPDYLPGKCRRNHKFTTWMLRAATDGFSRKNLVSKGETFAIYRGILRDGTQVKIEIYKNDISREVLRNFVEECKVLVQLRHKNLVQVLGWCSSRRMRAIVTEWTDGETIELWLSGSAAPPWKNRLKVLIGVVEGMCYMHDQWPEIGYDLRTSSVLLSHNFKPLISRFTIKDHQISSTKRINMFGLFLLEMIVNRSLREEFEQGEAAFFEFIRMHYPENLQNVIDGRMQLTGNMVDQIKQGIGLGLMCTDQPSGELPGLNQIYGMIMGVYQACLAITSEDHKGHKRSHSDVGRRNKHNKLR